MEDIMSSINVISELAPNAKAYPRLCRLLFLVCSRHARYCPMWIKCGVKSHLSPWIKYAALERLTHLLARVKKFLRQCSHKKHWEWIAASRYDRRWEVVELLSELQECVDIINSETIRTSEGIWARVLERLSDIEQEQDLYYDLHSLANEDCDELVKNASSEELVEYLSQRQSGYCPRITMEDWPTGPLSDLRLRWLGQTAILVELDNDEDLEVTRGPFLGPSSSIVQIFGWCHCHNTGKRYILTENHYHRTFAESSHRNRQVLTVSRLLEVTYQVAQTVLHLHRHGFRQVEIDLKLYNTVEFIVYWWRQKRGNATNLKSLLCESLKLFVKLVKASYGKQNEEALKKIMNQSDYDFPDMDVIIDILQAFRRQHAGAEWRSSFQHSELPGVEGIYRGRPCHRIELYSSDVPPTQFENLPKVVAELSVLQHPHIVRYYASEAGVKAINYPWIVNCMLFIYEEDVPGITLASLSFNEDEVRRYTYQILSGLEYLHSKGTRHGALTAANILVDTSHEVVKLSHYGIALQSIEVVPEMPAEYSDSLSADVWSLGCVVLEMIKNVEPQSKYSSTLSHFFGREVVNVQSGEEETPEMPGDSFLVDCNYFLHRCFERGTNRPAAAQLLDHPFVRRAFYDELERPRWKKSGGRGD
ncbi:uncharacterized protein LOC112346678 [Selaginella moellendorffii]|uniref:uncharacterized protein LOC112346678 n=1 Tax=Selaginella moellendorffii TaxID=88036 RepID=UPI000D1C3F85|nr:uncharacterized protein LOC112346678 [Selaginella moellendorffii]|eukprot:XP_024531946.1 uncharacterized protein LOC112346678 [Selaginella moellendorffii]